ncbi:DUF1003 domain-containing protein [Candidatus Daviesbacteria bacterium]|nr:DUF1003 domain-containing protein [Candidatus Daviesbacteria bacterium]
MAKKFYNIEKISNRMTGWIGTPQSVILHTLFFAGCFILPFYGVKIEDVLLVLTTAVSLEAIYLAIFIQMTVNRTSESLEEVQEDVKELGEEVEDISDDIEDIQEDEEEDAKTKITLENIETDLQKLLGDVEHLKKISNGKM